MIHTKLTDADLYAFLANPDTKPEPTSAPARGLLIAVPFGVAFWALLIWLVKS